MPHTLGHARDLVLHYSDLLRQQDLEAILNLLSDDIALQLPDITLSEKEAIRAFYKTRFSDASYQFSLAITDEKCVSDLYFINGLMTRAMIRHGQQEVTDMDFSFILRKENDVLKLWQMRIV